MSLHLSGERRKNSNENCARVLNVREKLILKCMFPIQFLHYLFTLIYIFPDFVPKSAKITFFSLLQLRGILYFDKLRVFWDVESKNDRQSPPLLSCTVFCEITRFFIIKKKNHNGYGKQKKKKITNSIPSD